MLYLSTRNKADSFTAYRVLHSDGAPDGGQFLPMQLPVLTDFQLAQFEQMNFGETVASVMNMFFGTKICGWDVDFAVGRQAVCLANIGHKVSVAESWHNPAGSHRDFVWMLYRLVCDKKDLANRPSLWFETAVHIAILFGAYGKLTRQEIYEFDIAVQTGDLQQLLAIRYAQKMGLPVRNIILGSLDGDGIWEFVSHGAYQCAGRKQPTGLEALLWLEFGPDESARYINATLGKGIYHLSALQLEQFRNGIFAAVVGDRRTETVISSTMHTDRYVLDFPAARAFGALQDYRAKTGVKRNTLLLSHEDPASVRYR